MNFKFYKVANPIKLNISKKALNVFGVTLGIPLTMILLTCFSLLYIYINVYEKGACRGCLMCVEISELSIFSVFLVQSGQKMSFDKIECQKKSM